ncbi:MAG: YeaC family protein [Agarilytica sp.]
MDIDQVTSALSPDIIDRFKRAIETGKWPDGKTLTDEQKEICMQAVIAYEHKHLGETDRTGYVPPKETPCAPKEEEAVKWKH